MSAKKNYALYPISGLYGAILKGRHWLYNKGILKSTGFNFPIICVGNLALGGTGKTPMTEYLVTLLKSNYNVATLSRGYKRKTKGFAIAGERTTAIDIGDEPMQFHKKFPGITVAVGEERLIAIPQLLHDRPETQVIILDDAFQHRPVKAGLNILLTSYHALYSDDALVPAGSLRDIPSSAERAEIIVVTKCPETLSAASRDQVIRKLKLLPHQSVFFTSLTYSAPQHVFTGKNVQPSGGDAVLLISGIAQPEPLIQFVHKQYQQVDWMQFPDHHIFNMDDLQNIRTRFNKIQSDQKIVLTTEKDGVRLEKFANELTGFPVYVLPVRHTFLFDGAAAFNQQILRFVSSFQS
ncbi:MAG TPA: tetraacyldisaccharide 4'-kinase [Ferruginibacter sp.]|nr:tetraacyldisaccharide 4'-kinase [Ferruginibacter sp.]HRQ19894.1 tetraacyldisaccharide 4'-kinase [Ferruginibacter sp.]